MIKVFCNILLVMLTMFFAVPSVSVAEAASVAFIPLINNVEGGDKLANQLYYKEGIAAVKRQQGFYVEDSAQVKSVIEAAGITNEAPDKKTLEKLAKEAEVDIIFAMQLNSLKGEQIKRSGDLLVELNMEGVAVAYNALNGVYYEHKFDSDKQIDMALTSRWDWIHEEFARQVRVELNHALKAKK